MNPQSDIVRHQDGPVHSTGCETEAAMDLVSWQAGLMARLDLAAPKCHARVMADAIREAVRLCHAGILRREAAIDVLVTAAHIFALTTAEIEEACMEKPLRQKLRSPPIGN